MKLTEKHKKRILWAAVLIIVPSFILWGSMALRNPDESLIGQIKGEPISHNEFIPYLNQAQLHWLLYFQEDQRPNQETLYSLAGDFYLLTYQANKEKISVNDSEVIESIQSMIFFQENNRFQPEKYHLFIEQLQRYFSQRFGPRNFEEYVRSTLKHKKLFSKHVHVEVSETEIRDAYKIDNQKAKINYLLIPYKALIIQKNIPVETLRNFYDQNREQFKGNFSQIQDKVETTYQEKQAKENAAKIAEDIIAKIQASGQTNLANYAANSRIQFKQTDFFKYFDYIEGLGLSRKISDLVFFELQEGEVYPEPIFKENGTYIIKVQEKPQLDLEKFADQRKEYHQLIKEDKLLQQRINYLNKLRSDLSFQLKPAQ